MSLFGTIQVASNALNAASLGLQVTGNNIANANTPDYIRQRLIEEPAVTARHGDLLLGLGVKVTGVRQVIDKFFDDRVRGAASDVASSEAQQDVYSKLEAAINELGDKDLSTQLTGFFGSLQDVLNQPDSVAARNVAAQKGQSLTNAVRRLDDQVRSIHGTVNQQIVSSASDINNLLTDVAKLNLQIVQLEGGGTSGSDAVGLRDRRAEDLAHLAEITDIKVLEQPTGDVTVYSGGDFLVTLGTARQVGVVTEEHNGLQVSHLEINETHSPLSTGSGRLGGLATARDEILQGFLTGLNDLSKTLINDFNKVYSGGQGLTGFSQVTSDSAVSSSTIPLDTALPFPVTSGAFQIQTYNKQSDQKTTTDIHIDLAGLDTDTTLQSLANQIDAINGISATVTTYGKLQISSDSPDVSFAFSGDNSGVLASLGINTFFSGTGSQDISVSQIVKDDPAKMAFSTGGVGQDSKNGALLANFIDAPLPTLGGASLATAYEHLVSNVALASQSATAAADGFRGFQQSLDGQRQAISGVNIDEEAVRMIEYQRTYQASARVIATVNELIQTLLNL